VVVLRAAIQPMHRSAEVVDDGQLGVAITYAQNPVHRSIADDHPVHLSPRTVDTDVKQGCETLAAEKSTLLRSRIIC